MTIDEAEKIKTVVENKDYIVQLVNAVAKSMIEAFENLKIEDVNMFQLGYNKAVDDFVEKLVAKEEKLFEPDYGGMLESSYERSFNNGILAMDDAINEIAKQLKAGGENE